MGIRSCGSPNLGNFETPNLGILGQNDIWVQAMWLCTMNIIRGRWWLPPNSGRGESYEFMFACGLFMHQKCSNYALTNLLFGLCMSMWIIDSLVTHLSPHPTTLTCPFIFEVLQAKEHTLTPYPFVVFTFRLTIESIKELGGVLVMVTYFICDQSHTFDEQKFVGVFF
jgi:hypothetical protein